MLSHLRVENFAVVEKVEIDFSPHLNIFTGETGAGKSILIDAISMFLKKKSPGNPVRPGKDKLVVEALFSRDGEECVLRREIGKTRSLAYRNGEMVPFTVLKENAEKLLNIYGQNEHVFLLQASNHRIFLDRFAGNKDLLAELSRLSTELKSKKKELAGLEAEKDRLDERLDLLAFQISEIESLKMEKGDEEKLEQRLKILSSSEEIMARSQELIQTFHQDENSIYNILSLRMKDIDYLKKIFPELNDYQNEMNNLFRVIPDFSAFLSAILNDMEYDEDEFNDLQERLHKLNRLKSKHNLSLDQLLDKCLDLKEERKSLLNVEFSIRETGEAIARLLREYTELNTRLRNRRAEKSRELLSLVEQELARLEMKQATFLVQVEESEPDLENFSERGTDHVEFYFSSNPGQKAGKIKDVVSGGELSRLMLVLKSIVEEERFSSYIFDEIDSGIGGKTAQFVGEKLKKISRSNQVICISHLPQIAAFADRHFLIRKEFKEDQTFSLTTELNDDETVHEIARLMAGRDVNQDVLAAARNLLTSVRKRS